MRTKLFSILMALMLLPSMAFALTYDEAKTAISNFDFRQWPNVANCNAELEIDDVVVDYATTNYTVMAYVNGTLRGYQNTARSAVPATGGPAHYIYTTDVWANAATENGEEITFYVLDEAAKKVYKAVHSHTWAEGTLEMPSSGGKIVVSTKVLVEEIVTTDTTVFATEVDASLFPGSNYAPMYNWCVDLTPYYTVLPEDATDRSVYITWDYTSNDYAVGRASNGKWYMFVAAGGTYATTIHANDLSAVSADLTLTVKIPVTDIRRNNPETVFRQDIITGGYDVSSKFTVNPDEATDKSVTYSLVSAKTTCDGTVTLGLWIPQDGTYTIDATRADAQVRLFDRGGQVSMPYTFDASAGTDNDRFTLVIETTPSGINDIYTEADTDDAVYDIMGRRVAKDAKGITISKGKKAIR